MSKAAKQSVDRSRVKKRTLGALKALSGTHDRRLRLIGWKINGIKTFCTMNTPDQRHFFELGNGLKDGGIQWLKMGSKKIHGWNWFRTPELQGRSSNCGLQKVVWAALIDSPYENGGRSMVTVHFTIWSSMDGNRTSLHEEWWGPPRSTVVKKIGLNRRLRCMHAR